VHQTKETVCRTLMN